MSTTRPVEESDRDVVWQWMKDPKFVEELGGGPIRNERQFGKWFDAMLDHDDEIVRVALDADSEVVAIGGLFEYAWTHRTAKIWAGVSPDDQRQGHGRVLAEELLRVAFEEQGLVRVTAEVDGFNERSRAFWEDGMRFYREGTIRQAVWARGRFWDWWYLGMLRAEWITGR
jgi:RimJ/RimL family protein N-acetyltransferase